MHYLPLYPHFIYGKDYVTVIAVLRNEPHHLSISEAADQKWSECPLPFNRGRVGVLQATIFEDVYRKYGHVLHESGSYLLDGIVKRDRTRGVSYLVNKIQSLNAILENTQLNALEIVAAGSGAFVRARCKGRRTG